MLQRPGQERKRNKEEDISLGGEEEVGTTQKIRNFLSLATAHLASHRQQHVSFRWNEIIRLIVCERKMLESV